MKMPFELFTIFLWGLRHQVSINKVCLATGTLVYLCGLGVYPEDVRRAWLRSLCPEDC